MASLIVVHPNFDERWPFVADHLAKLWYEASQNGLRGGVEICRIRHGHFEVGSNPAAVRRLAALGFGIESVPIERFPALEEMGTDIPTWGIGYRHILGNDGSVRKILIYSQLSEGHWGQSVAEFALALTLCGLRRIPQLHRQMLTDSAVWTPKALHCQWADDPNFANGTLSGKRVRIVGLGNIGSRYASWCSTMGADVAAYDPFASEPCFHRSGARREYHLERLVKDADIFAPMLRGNSDTANIIHRDLVRALPEGCLVVLVTRAGFVDMQALRVRVLADELALAADVWDVEPLPLDSPLLGRPNVIHTPHIAGRTRQANEAWAQALAAQFKPLS
jgi:phosphoglycerate dehydrogenase-like enzyme